MTAVVVIEAAVILLLLILVAGLLKSHAEILRQLDRLGGDDSGLNRIEPANTKSTGLQKAPTTQLSGIDPQGSARVVTLEHGRQAGAGGCCLPALRSQGSRHRYPASA